MLNLCVRSEKLSSNFAAHFDPLFRNLGSGRFFFRDRTYVVVKRRRHSTEKSSWVNFRRPKAGVLGSTLGKFAVAKLALIELRTAKITSRERTTLERYMGKNSSAEHAAVETTVLESRSRDIRLAPIVRPVKLALVEVRIRKDEIGNSKM